MTRRRALLLVVALLLLSGAWIGTPRVLRRLPFFRIHQVEVTGNHYLDADDVVRRLALPTDASIFDPLDGVRKAAALLPGTVGTSASVERRFPGTLRVKIVETVPVALAPVNDHLALLDYRGRVLPFDPVRIPTSMPVADRDSTTAAFLALLRQVDTLGYAQVQSARTVNGEILLETEGHTIRVRPNADVETIRSIAAVRSLLDSTSRHWTEIDARYQGRLFVKKAKA